MAWLRSTMMAMPPVYLRDGGRRSRVTSAPRHLGPGHVLVDPRLARQAQHPLAHDVALDLRRAALDRVGPRAQEHLAGRSRWPHEPQALGAAHRVVVALERRRAEQVDAQLVDRHVDLGELELGDRALGPGVA